MYIANASQITLANVQLEMAGEAKKAGFENEDDVVSYIKELRKSKMMVKDFCVRLWSS